MKKTILIAIICLISKISMAQQMTFSDLVIKLQLNMGLPNSDSLLRNFILQFCPVLIPEGREKGIWSAYPGDSVTPEGVYHVKHTLRLATPTNYTVHSEYILFYLNIRYYNENIYSIPNNYFSLHYNTMEDAKKQFDLLISIFKPLSKESDIQNGYASFKAKDDDSLDNFIQMKIINTVIGKSPFTIFLTFSSFVKVEELDSYYW